MIAVYNLQNRYKMILGGFISLLIYIDQKCTEPYKKSFSGYTIHKALYVLDSQHKNYPNFVNLGLTSCCCHKLGSKIEHYKTKQ